ncbi:MAG: ATP-binding protein [Rickettsiales bacterium]|jgi:predicted AAA+ superfamily ATPase|nr:ATP-binding protein [Rickettsiales bacterium]
MKNRDIYLQKLVDFKDKNVIKVITGIRRCGKSTMLKLFIEYLKENKKSEENIIYMNFESLKYGDLDYKLLYNTIKNQIENSRNKKKFYLFFDEIQVINFWEKTINSLFVDFDVDIYITGSNAYLLSSELSTYLSGRYIEIKLLPLSFKEFINFNKFSENTLIDDKFNLYLKYGGLPGLAEFNFNEKQINMVLDGIYSAVVVKDIMQQVTVKEPNLLNKIVLFLADNIGSINSPNNIGNVLVNSGIIEKQRIPNSKTIENYIKLLENAYIFYNAKRYDIKGKEYLKTLEKHYIVDTGIRNYLLGYRDVDRGHVLENIIYLELIRRDYKVSIGKVNNKEIDFIATRQSEKIYFQVSETIAGENTRNRELEPLKMINDNYEKIILTMDKNFVSSYDGIKVKNIIDFLMEE